MTNELKETVKKIISGKASIVIRNFRNSYNEFRQKNKVGGFDIIDVYRGHFNIKYRGIPNLKCPFDYVIYQMILSELKPDLIIDIGTNNGGGTLYLADLMENIGHGIIHTIDIKDQSDKLIKEHKRIKIFINGWENYDIKKAGVFKKTLIIDDASHTYEDVLKTLNKFSPLVSVGSYFIVEDGIVTKLGREKSLNGGPLRATKEFLSQNSKFEIDRKYCDMFGKNATFNPDGYLKRIS